MNAKLFATLSLAAVAAAATPLLAQPASDEAGVRAALAACVEAWNRHDPKAFGDVCLTEDVWFSEADDSFYKRFRGRDKVLGLMDYSVRNSDLQWEVVRIKPLADGTVAVSLKQRVGMLPKKDGQYASRFDSDPSFARLRRQDGAWKLQFFTSDRGWARALIAELDAPAAAPAAAASRAAVTAIPLPAQPGLEPPIYTRLLGERGSSCEYCHGRPPALSESLSRGRIVASGAAAADAGALRRAMSAPALGGMMDKVLADPALTDAQLDAIRLWMKALRDGRAEQQPDRIVIHNPRSDRDPPVRLASLRAEGGLRLPANSGCRVGTRLAGGTHCEIRLGAGSGGALIYRFADSPGLEPQAVRIERPR